MLTVERLREVLEYNPDTGEFSRLKGRRKVGGISRSNRGYPYIRIKIDGKSYLAQRLAWLYMTGEWPDNEIDHENRNSLDNKWLNLRNITHLRNVQNCKSLRENNISGVSGVRWHKQHGRWHVRVKGKHFGSFINKDDAIAARLSC